MKLWILLLLLFLFIAVVTAFTYSQVSSADKGCQNKGYVKAVSGVYCLDNSNTLHKVVFSHCGLFSACEVYTLP